MSTSQPDNRISQANFAKKLKVNRQALTNAFNAGKLVKHGKGRQSYINLDCPLTIAYMKSDSANRHRGKVGVPASKPDPKSTKKPGKKSSPAPAENDDDVQAYLDKQEIKHLKIKEEHEKLRLANAKTRGELIDRTVIQDFMHKLHEIDNGLWKTLGLKIASDVAAVFGSDDDALVRKVCDVVEKETFNILKQVKDDQNEFLKELGARKLPAKGKAA